MVSEREVRIEYVPLRELLKSLRMDNPKAHDLAAIGASVQRVGFITPVIRNERDGRALAGHGRAASLETMRDRGESPPAGIKVAADGEWLVPTVCGVELGADDAKAFVIADNRTSELGGWDEAKLAALTLELYESEGGLAGVGYDVEDLDHLLANLLAQIDVQAPGPDEAPPIRAANDVYVMPGEIYALGQHRVACGDSRNAEFITALLGDRRAHCLVSDAPYGVAYEGGTREKLRIPGDQAEGLPALLAAAFAAVDRVLAPGASIYLFHPAGPLSICFEQAVRDVGWRPRQGLVWLKDQFVLGRSDYHYRHEPILYAHKAGGGRSGRGSTRWHGGNDASSVLEYPRPKASHEHPTMKPVVLLESLLRNSTVRGEVVIDPFLGSGSTLIAAERLGRRCFGVDIDAAFAQVAIERWQAFTGQRATLEGKT